MVAVLRPRWLVLAALVALIVGAVGMLAGDLRYSPMALLVAELLIIYAAILWATPTIPPLSTLPAAAPPAQDDHPTADTGHEPNGEEQIGNPVTSSSDEERHS